MSFTMINVILNQMYSFEENELIKLRGEVVEMEYLLRMFGMT